MIKNIFKALSCYVRLNLLVYGTDELCNIISQLKDEVVPV